MKILGYDVCEVYSEKTGNKCVIHAICVEIDDIEERAREMIRTIVDTTWMNEMDIISKASFEACSERTIQKFKSQILEQVSDEMNTEFGEIMISDTAQCVLVSEANHCKLPLADLFKERVSGNGGFDFHTISSNENIIYGEAKYSGVTSRYADALSQINEFIEDKKDIAELNVLRQFVSESASLRAINGSKGYTAAFSLVCTDRVQVMKNAAKSTHLSNLFEYEEIYLIGVEVND